MTTAIPRPNTTTRRNPNAGRPATIDPSRMIRALVEGMSPPASPSANRPRQLIVDPAGGTWEWRTPPWLCSGRGHGRAAWSWSSACSWSCSCACPWSCDDRRRSARATATDLAGEHPPADREDRHRRDHRGNPDHDVGRQHALGAHDERREHEDPERVRDRHRQPEADRVERRPARADEVGRHQRLAVPRRQRMTGAEANAVASDRRATSGVRSTSRKIAGSSAADPARDRAGDRRSGRGVRRRRRPLRALPRGAAGSGRA